jgi:hypothetical protein
MVIEKPFGKDSDSYMQLASAIAAEFSENQMYRIDHYLGKEVRAPLSCWWLQLRPASRCSFFYYLNRHNALYSRGFFFGCA